MYLFILFFFAFLMILHGLPLSLDDYGFQSKHFETAAQALSYVLGYGNGRVLGNSGILFLTHHLFLADLLRAVLLSGIAILLPSVLQLKNHILPWMSAFLLLTVSPSIFGQAYSWLSGFQNYVPPIFLFLCGLWFAERAGCLSSKGLKVFLSVISFLCSISMQLYIEHSTCINLFLAVLTVAAVWKRAERKSFHMPVAMFFAGAVLGTLIMGTVTIISNPQIQGGTIGHTSYLSSGLKSLAYGITRNGILLLGMFSENAVLLLLLSALQTLQILNNKAAFSDRELVFCPLGMLLPSFVFLFQLAAGLHPWYGKLAVFESVWITIAWVVFLTALIVSWKKLLICKESAYRCRFAGLLIGIAVFGILPLLVIWPIGYRCLLHSSVALMGAVLVLSDELLSRFGKEKEKKVLVAVVSVFAAVVICESMLFADARRMVSIRDAFVKEQARIGADSAAVFLIPSPYIYESWNEETEHYRMIEDHLIRLKILPADVWFRLCYYHYT